MAATPDPESVVRRFFDVFNKQTPEQFDELIAPDYLDYGQTPVGVGPKAARTDYEYALKTFGHITYDLNAVVPGDDRVAVVWTGHMPDNKTFQGLSLYRVSHGRLAETRHAVVE
jgi:ketosteroid isomerase-like protein